jgi:hypothetical protein
MTNSSLSTRNLWPIVVGSRPLVAGSLYAFGHTLHTELGRQAHQAYAEVHKHLWPPSGKKKHVGITYNFDKKVEHDKKPSRQKSLGLKLLKYQKA